MTYSAFFLRGVAASALLFATATPALAQSRTDRARMAITEAQAKVDAAVKIGATTHAPELMAEAQASLRTAQEDFARHDKDATIDDAHHASQLADEALGVTERNKAATANAERDRAQSAETAATAAQADADAQRDGRATAEAAADSAQANAAQANDRAAQAQQAASASAADAAAARAAAAKPATTVTVERTEGTVTQPAYSARPAPAVRRPAARRPAARKPARAAPATRKTTTTTTTIKTEPTQ